MQTPKFILTRLCETTFALETKLFLSKAEAEQYCWDTFNISDEDWEAYLIKDAEGDSELKYNNTPVEYCGWKAEADETFYIHKVTEENSEC